METFLNLLPTILQILTSIGVLIPLVVELVKYVQKAVKEKNWQNMIKLALNLMEEAESKFNTGAERKEWVISMVKASAETINYELDEEALGVLIDSIIAMTKTVNAK